MQSNFSKYIKLLPCILYSLKIITYSLKDFAKIFSTIVATSKLLGSIQFTVSFIFIIETSPTAKTISNTLFPHNSSPL